MTRCTIASSGTAGCRPGWRGREAEWLLADYLDCILHIFTPKMRERYRLEVLWGEAETLEL